MDARPARNYDRPQLDKLGDRYYFISKDIYDVTDEPHILNEDEIELLPLKIIYTGPRIEFSTDEKQCYKLLIDIIEKFNLMQNPKFYSFPLGKEYFQISIMHLSALRILQQALLPILLERCTQLL